MDVADIKKEPCKRKIKNELEETSSSKKPRIKKAVKAENASLKDSTIAIKPERESRKCKIYNEINHLDEPSTSHKAEDFLKPKVDFNKVNYGPQWTVSELLSEQQNLTLTVGANIVGLLDAGNTIPFIARYRRDLTNNMSPEILREVKDSYDEIIELKNKIGTVVKTLEKNDVLTSQLKHSVITARSIEELEYVYAPFKPGSKRSLAVRAKEVGLEEPALAILDNKNINLFDYVTTENKELSTVDVIEKGIIHIFASIIATDTSILSDLRELRKRTDFKIKTKKMISKKNTEKSTEEFKFENYMDFELSVRFVKPHQILAINRGESLKILSVKVIVPEFFYNSFKKMCLLKWKNNESNNGLKEKLLNAAIEDSYNRLVQPLIIREIRSELKQKADRASCEVFSTNLKHLLLAKPIKGECILGIDPGFANGCKLALISAMGEFMFGNIIYPHKANRKDQDVEIIRKILVNNNCDLIALGNGTACRQTEEWLSNLIKQEVFKPLNVRYTIVREEGASIYSCSTEAKKEFPKTDPNIISAVSLARRVQEPLAELVKVEPKHLGVGMYQHDIKKKQLEEALKSVVSECVSFVGVDLNTTSQCLLKHVAGLSEKKAQQIIEFRIKNGPFTFRKQILEVSGIGERIFQQCAGFLRVGPLSSEDAAFYQKSKTCRLDCTYIHPESYDVTIKLIKKLGLELSNLGDERFTAVVRNSMQSLDLNKTKDELKCTQETLQFILDTLCKPLNYDLRNDIPTEPIFKKELTSVNDLKSGTVLTGKVANVTHFGCFVDIGVGFNGLIHCSKYRGLNIALGNRIEAKVISVEVERKRIGLEAVRLL